MLFLLLQLLAAALLVAAAAFALDRKWRRARVSHVERKSVFITGTDSGFGRALALKLHALGLKVYAGCYTAEGAESLRRDVTDDGRLTPLRIDVTDRKSLEEARDHIAREQQQNGGDSGLWGVVNNAGVSGGAAFEFASADDFRCVMEVNFFGVLNTNEIFRSMVSAAKGRIVNVVSALGRVNVLGEPYTVSKHALEPYSDGLRRMMRAFDVHVAIVEPGFYRTNITSWANWEQETNLQWRRMLPDLRDRYGGDDFRLRYLRFLRGLNGMRMSKWNALRHVPDAITHALLSRRPKDRYVCGYDAFFATRIAPFVPDWLADAILRVLMRYPSIAEAAN